MSEPLTSIAGATVTPQLPHLDITKPQPGGGTVAPPPDIDITKPQPGAGTVQEIAPRTSEWATIAKPFTYFLLCLIAAVMLLPFAWFLFQHDDTDMLDWAKTILAPVIGFGGAVVGYYFGTGGSSGGSKTP